MYKSYLSVNDSKTGSGVFTKIAIPAGSPVCQFKGDFFTSATLRHDYSQVLQVGPDAYLGPSGDIDDYINHSCDPNCTLNIVGNRAILNSLYIIPVGAEITFDYSTSSTDSKDAWEMKCRCGSNKCRGGISGYQYLSDELKEDYKKRGLLPMFITNRVFGAK